MASVARNQRRIGSAHSLIVCSSSVPIIGAIELSNDPGGYAAREAAVRKIMGYHGAGADDGVAANVDSRKDANAGREPDISTQRNRRYPAQRIWAYFMEGIVAKDNVICNQAVLPNRDARTGAYCPSIGIDEGTSTDVDDSGPVGVEAGLGAKRAERPDNDSCLTVDVDRGESAGKPWLRLVTFDPMQTEPQSGEVIAPIAAGIPFSKYIRRFNSRL